MSKFWIDDIKSLFNSATILPNRTGDVASNLNALTRFAILMSLIIAVFSPILGLVTLVVCLITILTVHVSSGRATNVERFTETHSDLDDTVVCTANDMTQFVADEVSKKVSNRFCNDFRVLTPDDQFVSVNQLLVGGPNPKTLVPPIVAVPSHELNYWKASGLTTHSAINSSSNFDFGRSGYSVPTFGPYTETDDFANNFATFPRSDKSRLETVTTQTIQPGVFQRSRFDEPINSMIGISLQKQFDPMLITENGNVTYTALDGKTPLAFSNGGVGTADAVYDNNIHVDRSNHTRATDRLFNLDDLLRNRSTVDNVDTFQSESNVYDPRLYGYGSNDRYYLDSVTGQPRWFYDDIESITRPNYISRNKVDVFPWAPQYGSDVPLDYSRRSYVDMANTAYMDATIQFRTEMQERLMRKRNAEMWQRRVAPIFTGNNSGANISYVR